MNTERLRDPLTELVASLERMGFAAVTTRAAGGFGDRSTVLVNPPLAVRVVVDRSQWFIELAREGCDDWFLPDVWQACLNDEALNDEPAPLTAQTLFLVENMPRLAAAAATQGDELIACLRRKRSARARRGLGLDG
jgi:hypothetical protein